MVPQGGECRLLGQRVGDGQGRGGSLGAVPLGQWPAALPVRGDRGQRVQDRDRQCLRLPIERTVGRTGMGQHLRAQHLQGITTLGGVGEERVEEQLGVSGSGQ